ncbi:GNAT family N-acetyltransferase [Candidatus Poribacteria bacterium]|nr:GNAT family N-acetyltransferase [Candidatus Poribacteria bacterium]
MALDSILISLTTLNRKCYHYCNITASKDGEEVGVCRSLSGGMFFSHSDAQKWIYTDWLGVEEEFQGQGLGKYLLQYSLQEMHKVGYRHASLSTD